MNQAVSFGLLLGGGILLYSSLTGTSLADIAQGHGGTVSQTGSLAGGLGTLTGNSIANVGAGIGNAISGVANRVGALSGYTNPFAAASMVTPERVDQGQDFSLAAGSPILAPGNSKYLGAVTNWWQNQTYYAYQLLSGPLAGQNYYIAEQVNPATTTPGQTIPQGQPIGYYAASGTGLEIGWAGTGNNWRQTLAQQTGNTGGANHANAPAGENFHQFLVDIGALP